MPPHTPPALLLLLLALGRSARGCPAGCQCTQPRTVFCTARQGIALPVDIPPDTAHLYVFENGITTLDTPSLASLPGLQLLDLSQNQLASLPSGVFQPLANLSNLDLTANRLREITNETFLGLHRLERLYLGKNRIRRIQPGAFDALGRLLELKLPDNELGALPPLRLPRLLLLDLSRNPLPALEPGALDAANMEALRLAGLGLQELDAGLLGRLRNLHDLDVADNQLEQVPPAVRGLRSLTRLRLAGNTRLAQLRPEDLAGLSGLQELDLSNLSLRALPPELAGLFPRLRMLAAARNPFNCVCPLSWFGAWVRDSGLQLASPEETRCHFPPKNAGRLLLDLDYADFGCPATTTSAVTSAATETPSSRPKARELTPPPASPAPTGPGPAEVATTEAPSLSPTVPVTARPAPGPRDCPASTCLNGGTCHLGPRRQLECVCPEGFEGLYCESPPQPSPATATGQPPGPLPLSLEPASPTSLRVELRRYVQARPAQIRGLRLTYRNLSGPDKRSVTLRLPASLAEYTVTQLQPNATYSVCVRPLGPSQGPEGEEACGEARTPPAARSSHAPVTQAREGNLPLLIAPALAAMLLALLAAVGAAYCVRRGRAAAALVAQGKGQTGPLELEGVKAPLEQGPKAPEGGGEALAGGPECTVPLMGYSGAGPQGPLPAKPYI